MASGNNPKSEAIILKPGMVIDLPARNTTVTIAPLTTFKGKDLQSVLPPGNPNWNTGYRLTKTAWVFHSVVPGSVVVQSNGITFDENKDYVVNYNWGTLCRTPTSAIPTNALCDIDYRFTPARVDLVEVADNGVVTVKQGKEHRHAPEIPPPDPGATPLFNVYLSHATMELTESNLLRMDPSVSPDTPVQGAEHLAKFRTKLKSNAPVKVVCLGDSITNGSDAGDDRYVYRLRRYLEKIYPGRTEVINAGVGGDTSRDALKRIDKDVLAHNPDLVIIMFGVNDENVRPGGNCVPVPQYRNNLKAMIDSIREKTGADVILMTTSWKNLGWEFTKGNLNEYADAVRSLGKELQVCVVDNFQAWANLEKRGIPYMNLLNSCINHPTGPAHELFMNGLITALEQESR